MVNTEIITSPDDVSPYLEDIKSLADKQKRELGFIPHSAYSDCCHKGNIVVAINTTMHGNKSFAGYALLGGRFPTKRIFQLAVIRRYRGLGIGRAIVEKVIEDAYAGGFYEIKVKIGKQLPADKFWEKESFELVNTVRGGQLHPQSNIRIKELIPTLFSAESRARLGLQIAATQISSEPASYLLDTNIVLDISLERPNTESSQNLMRLIAEGDITVAVAESAVRELERHSQSKDDVALKMISNLPRFSLGNAKKLKHELRQIIFPSKQELDRREISDVEQVATVATNPVRGFITRDEQILKKQEVLRNKLSREILSPFDFWGEDDFRKFDAVSMGNISTGETLTILPSLTSESKEKIKNNSQYQIDEQKFNYATFNVGDSLVANCAIEKRLPKSERARSAVLLTWDNKNRGYMSTMIDYVYNELVSDGKPSSIHLSLHERSEALAKILLDRGYLESADGEYKKIYVGPVLAQGNWKKKKREVQRLGPISISLPDEPPSYSSYNQNISIGAENKVRLQALEDFLSAVFLLPGRDGVIVPIKKNYADAFFGHSPQLSLIDPPEARLSAFKSYFGTRAAASRLLVGKLLFFYQSQTRASPGEIIAFARIVQSHLVSRTRARQESQRRGVLDDIDFEKLTSDRRVKTILETIFTHSVIFPKPITLKELRKIGCDDKANFVSAFNITHLQACALLEKGLVL